MLSLSRGAVARSVSSFSPTVWFFLIRHPDNEKRTTALSNLKLAAVHLLLATYSSGLPREEVMRLPGVWLWLLLYQRSGAFIAKGRRTQDYRLPYYPLDVDKICGEERLSFDRESFQFSLVEEKDLNEVAELSMMSFYTARIKLNTEGMVGLERALWYLCIPSTRRI